jgi:hypothetical protein
MKMREELQKQMEAHKIAKIEEKKNDLEYFEQIRRQKDVLAREDEEKKEAVRKRILEQKIVRDQQIVEQAKAKTQ